MLKARVEAGPHRRINTPIKMRLKGSLPNDSFVLIGSDGEKVPVQISKPNGEIELCWILSRLEKFEHKDFLLVKEPLNQQNPCLEVKSNEDQTTFLLGSQTVMSCLYPHESSKPFIYPLNGPRGHSLTWNSPPDHVHHKSIWTAHGIVNGEDLWLEGPGCGRITVVNTSIETGCVFSEIRLGLLWQSTSGERLVDENRVVRLWNVPDKQWLIDYASSFTASYGDVLFGDTKEAGMISIRVRESMEVENGGRIENSWGGINEAECWGRKANWCDYSGPVEGLWQGIAIFDHATNPRHPSYWHVRDYGLMAANIFGVTEFGGREDEKGGLMAKSGDTVIFRYRIYVHEGDAQTGRVSNKYLDYVASPKVSVLVE